MSSIKVYRMIIAWTAASATTLAAAGVMSAACVVGGDSHGSEAGLSTTEQALVTCPTVDPTTRVAYPSGNYVEAYFDRQSYGPDETINVHASARYAGAAADVVVTYYRLQYSHGSPWTSLVESRATKTSTSPVPATGVPPVDASHCGARWLAQSSLGLSPSERTGWPSGLYAARLSLSGDSSKKVWVPFVVKGPSPVTKPVVVVAATNTWQAYNNWPATVSGARAHSYYQYNNMATPTGCGSGSAGPLYTKTQVGYFGNDGLGFEGDPSNPPNCGVGDGVGAYSAATLEEGRTVNFLRPNPKADPWVEAAGAGENAHTVRAERETVDWLLRHSVDFSMIADSDDAVINGLDASVTGAVIIHGHNEYWTSQMRSAVKAYLDRGGHVLNVSGNTMNWEVTYGGTPDQMRTMKGDPPATRTWQRCHATDYFELTNNAVVLGTTFGSYFSSGTTDHNSSYVPSDLKHWLVGPAGFVSTSDEMGYSSESASNSNFVPDPEACGTTGTPCKAFANEIDVLPKNGTPDDVSSVLIARAKTAAEPFYGLRYTGKAHGGGVLGGASIWFTQSLDTATGSGATATDAEPKFSALIQQALHRFSLKVPVAHGDFTGKTANDLDFYSDYYCHIPAGDTWSGHTWVAPMRSGGAHNVYGNAWNASWCGATGDRFGLGDFNGDRAIDAYCYHNGGTLDVALSDRVGSLTVTPPTAGGTNWLTGFYCDPGAGVSLVVGDVDGNGRDDIICHNGTGVAPSTGYTWVARALSTGLGFAATETWTTSFCSAAGNQVGTADFNGDGLADLWCHYSYNGSTYVALSSGFTPGAPPAFADPYNGGTSPWLSSWCGFSPSQFGTADFNGDGFADVYCHSTSSAQNFNLWIDFGTGKPPAEGAFRHPYVSDLNTGAAILTNYCSTGQFGIGDFGGFDEFGAPAAADGRADIYCHTSTGTSHRLIKYARSAVSADCSTTRNGTAPYAHVNWSFEPEVNDLPAWCNTSVFQFGSGE